MYPFITHTIPFPLVPAHRSLPSLTIPTSGVLHHDFILGGASDIVDTTARFGRGLSRRVRASASVCPGEAMAIRVAEQLEIELGDTLCRGN